MEYWGDCCDIIYELVGESQQSMNNSVASLMMCVSFKLSDNGSGFLLLAAKVDGKIVSEMSWHRIITNYKREWLTAKNIKEDYSAAKFS